MDDIWQFRRAPELPLKSYGNPVFTDKPPFQPGGPTIIYDKEEKVFKCWYGVHDADLYYAGLPGAYNMCYMLTDDGLSQHFRFKTCKPLIFMAIRACLNM